MANHRGRDDRDRHARPRAIRLADRRPVPVPGKPLTGWRDEAGAIFQTE